VLRDELKKAPIRDVIGIVDASGAGGSNSKGQTFWTLKFDFKKWRFSGGEVQEKSLALSKEVTKDELGVFRSQVKPYDILRVRAHVSEKSSGDSIDALLIELAGKDHSDLELRQLAQQLQNPVTFQDSQFGIFQLDRRVNWYEADVSWNSKPARLTLRVDKDLDPEPALKTARLLWNSQSDWDRKIYDCAIQKLLKIKNDSWLQSGDEKVTSQNFKDKMALEAVIVAADGEFEFWFEDGDLFWGHSIRVDGSISEGPTNAGIEG
jgi:hypothetical protein